MLLPKISHSDSLQLYMDVAEVVEINGHRRGLWGLTGTLRNLQSESNHIIFLNSLLHDSVWVILHFIWEIGLKENWFGYCDFYSFAPFLTFFSSQCWQRLQVGWWKITVFRFSSVAQSCPTLCDPMKRSTTGLPVHHQLPEFTQTHVLWVSYAFQPSHPL